MPISTWRRWCALAAFALVPATSQAAAPTVPAYDHVFLTIQENHGIGQIIGNPAAPNVNALAAQYGLALRYTSTTDPSAPNYVAMLGGDSFGIADDNPYYTHTVDAPSLMSQLTDAGISWRGYFQGMPYAGYREICFPGRCNGVPDFDPYYAAKHNGMIYFRSIQNVPSERTKMRPLGDLQADLAGGHPPRFGYIVADQCRDMHGSPPWCGDGGNNGDTNDNQLIARGDAFVGALVARVTAAPFWQVGHNALVVVWDEGNGHLGCCDANPGTGTVAVLVITNAGPRGLRDTTPYNHYSLLATIEQALGVGCIGYACDTKHVVPMAPLFAIGTP